MNTLRQFSFIVHASLEWRPRRLLLPAELQLVHRFAFVPALICTVAELMAERLGLLSKSAFTPAHAFASLFWRCRILLYGSHIPRALRVPPFSNLSVLCLECAYSFAYTANMYLISHGCLPMLHLTNPREYDIPKFVLCVLLSLTCPAIRASKKVITMKYDVKVKDSHLTPMIRF